jgi:hypothetical protein
MNPLLPSDTDNHRFQQKRWLSEIEGWSKVCEPVRAARQQDRFVARIQPPGQESAQRTQLGITALHAAEADLRKMANLRW